MISKAPMTGPPPRSGLTGGSAAASLATDAPMRGGA